MCFSIPGKVVAVKKDIAYLESGNIIKLGSELKVVKGEYLQVIGNVAVGKLSKSQGLKVRRLIKSLN